MYIGSTICGGSRLSRYFFNSVLAAGLKVYLNILLHGHSSFSVAILEDLGPTGSISVTAMLAREQYYIDILFRDFPQLTLNSSLVAGSSTDYKHTQAAKDLIAASRIGKPLSPETRELLNLMFTGVNNPFYGETHSPATLAAMSASKIGPLNPMHGRAKSPEFIAMQTRDKTGANNPQFGIVKSEKTIAKLTKLVYVYVINLVLIGSYSTTQCLSTFGIGSDTLYKYLANGKVYKGHLFRRTKLNT